MDLFLGKTFTLCFGSSTSLDIPIFKRFKSCLKWCLNGALELNGETQVIAELSITFLNFYMERSESYIRCDYKDLIESTLIVLECPPVKLHWKATGSNHHAR